MPALLARVAGQPGVRVDGTRARFDPALVDGFVQAYRASRPKPEPPGDALSLEILTGYALYLVEPETDQVRPMTTADCVRMARLVGALYPNGVRGGTPGQPQDVPSPLRQLMAYKIGCEQTVTNGWVGFTALAELDYLTQMARVTGSSIGLGIFPRDPLCLDGPTVTMALHCLDHGVDIPITITNMAIRGVSAPVQLPGAFVSSLATVLGAYTVFKLIGTDLSFYVSVFPFDFRVGTIAYGTPDHILCNLFSTQFCAYYGTGWGFFQSLHTNAIFADAHALLQRGAFSAIAALAGARHFGYGGCGGIDVTFSPELLLYDVELLRYLEHVITPTPFDVEALALEAIAATGPGGAHLTSDATLDACRSLWTSNIFSHLPVEQVAATDVKARACRHIDALIEGYEQEINGDQLRELDAIYAHAERQFV
ncbi:MAG: Trimethylamine methyltransferase (MTTB) [bacterium ADurb.Bin429]|nr:MAG: Trimethylamine methyltransferase (MTTB) [bacterium ADurb.Bin429]